MLNFTSYQLIVIALLQLSLIIFFLSKNPNGALDGAPWER